MTLHAKFLEFKDLIKELTPTSSPDMKQTVFEFIQAAWESIGEHPEVKKEVCEKLGISSALFNAFVLNPHAVRGIESLHRFLRPGWLQEYLDYTLGNEAPEEFHLWVGLTILGSALKRNVFIDHLYYQIYPNLYTILVAPPGLCKKTTAASIGEQIAREAECIKIFSEKITPEALAKSLSRGHTRKIDHGMRVDALSQGLLYAPELTVFLGREQYNEPLVLLLTRLYDCMKVWEYESIKHEVIPLRDVFVCLLGCTTPTELQSAIPASARGGGLLSRLVIIYKTHTPRCFPVPVLDDPTRKDLLVAKLRRLSDTVKGQFVLTTEALDWWNSYYIKWKANAERMGTGVSEREPYMTLKIAMLLCASEERGLLIPIDALQRALAIVTSAYATWGEMTTVIETSSVARFQTLVFESIRKGGGVMGRSALTKRLYGRMRGRDIEEAVEFLKTAGMIKQFEKDGALYYRLATLKEASDEG
jgi:hypothetical protein